MMHGLNHQESPVLDEFSRGLQCYTLSFLPPLIIRSSLPSPLRMEVTSGTMVSRWIPVHLGPGGEQEICSINIQEKSLILRLVRPGSSLPSHVQLRRRDGFTKECDVHAADERIGKGDAASNVMRVLFSVHVDMRSSQTLVSVSSPLWVVNKCGTRVHFMLPNLDPSASHLGCIGNQGPHVLSCETCSMLEPSQIRLLGFPGALMTPNAKSVYIMKIKTTLI